MSDHLSLQTLAELPQMKTIANVLYRLRSAGLENPCVAGGFTRDLALGKVPHDMDIHYIGTVPTVTARSLLTAILQAEQIPGEWDIWNFTEHDATITDIERGYISNFISTIDCLYVNADGDVIDLTGRGIADAQQRILEFTHLLYPEYHWSSGQLCYHLLEGCRRIFLYQLIPTQDSEEALLANTHLWAEATMTEREYLRQRLHKKLSVKELTEARHIYTRYGWDMVFVIENV